jgi:hypothetical protein
LYNWKEKINGSHRDYTKPEESKDILSFLEVQNEWLYNDGQNSNRGTYTEKITSVKNKISPISKRY